MFGSQPPWGEGAREGWELQPPDRREGGLQLAPLMGGAEGGNIFNVGYFIRKFDKFAIFLSVKSDVALS